MAANSHDHQVRLEAKASLKYPAVKFTGQQARAIVDGFADLIAKLKLVVHACSILPDHVHLVLARRNGDIEEVAAMLMRAGTRHLNKLNINPMANFRKPNGRIPSPWAEDAWCVFIDSPRQMRYTIEYVEVNPEKAGLKPQRWGFVVPYAG